MAARRPPRVTRGRLRGWRRCSRLAARPVSGRGRVRAGPQSPGMRGRWRPRGGQHASSRQGALLPPGPVVRREPPDEGAWATGRAGPGARHLDPASGEGSPRREAGRPGRGGHDRNPLRRVGRNRRSDLVRRLPGHTRPFRRHPLPINRRMPLGVRFVMGSSRGHGRSPSLSGGHGRGTGASPCVFLQAGTGPAIQGAGKPPHGAEAGTADDHREDPEGLVALLPAPVPLDTARRTFRAGPGYRVWVMAGPARATGSGRGRTTPSGHPVSREASP